MSLRNAFALAATLLGLAFGAAAQAPQQYQTLASPQAPGSPGKIEVLEFFWYGCPHCYTLEPAVDAWVKKAPADVAFVRVPAVPSPQWAEAATLYYTLEAMGLLDKYHGKVFDAFHKENKNLSNRRIREEWLSKNGIDVAKYNETEKSFSVATKVQRARQLTSAYRVDGVPRIFVAGKYYTAAEFAGGMTQIFPVVDQLVAMARKESGNTAGAAPAAARK